MTTANDTDRETVAERCERLVQEHFKQHPFEKPHELETFVPAEDGVLLLKDNVIIPKNTFKTSIDAPSLLLHNLANLDASTVKEKAVYKFIDTTRNMCSGLYGTSGAGKTRSAYEYLSLNFGLYFVANTTNDPGSQDLSKLIARCKCRCKPNAQDLDSQAEAPASTSNGNYVLVLGYVNIMILVRNAVFAALNEQLKSKSMPELTPYQWLLIQLFPNEAAKEDIFASVQCQCFEHHNTLAQAGVDDTSVMAALDSPPKWWTTMVVDEAQLLLNQLDEGYFLSRCGTKKRSLFSAVLKAMSMQLDEKHNDVTGYPLACGTGMSIDELQDQSESIFVKNPLANFEDAVFKEFPVLTESDVRNYILSFLSISTDTNYPECIQSDCVIEHTSQWLRGRPRTVATFLEVYLTRKKYKSNQDNSQVEESFP